MSSNVKQEDYLRIRGSADRTLDSMVKCIRGTENVPERINYTATVDTNYATIQQGEVPAMELCAVMASALHRLANQAPAGMEVKVLEVRDRHTFIPVIAINPAPRTEAEAYLLGRVGYPLGNSSVIVLRANDSAAHSDPHDWYDGSRTMREAHKTIERDWIKLQSGDVIDVEFEAGETTEKKVSERIEILENGR